MAYVVGNSTDQNLTGGAEDDTLKGVGGNDTLVGNGGNDLLVGGTGNDQITGDGQDTLLGGVGNDTLTSFMGQSSAYGGAGNDRIIMDGYYYAGSGTSGHAYGGLGDDFVLFHAPTGGSATGGDGTDLLAINVSGNFGNLTGGAIDFSAGSGTFTGPGALGLTFHGFERLHFQGNDAADTVVGGALDDVAYLYGGANQASMGAGNDTLASRYGGQQTLHGGDGDDLLILMDPVVFPVYFIVSGFDGKVDDGQLSDITGFERYEILGSFEDDIISLGTGDDTAFGFTGADSLYGAVGNDLLKGQGGDDSLFGGEGGDTLVGGGGNDVLYGDGGNDQIILNMGNDYGFGDAGDDRLVLQGGTHTAWGGLGSDTFLFRRVDANYDWLGDFTSGEDRLRFEAAELQGAPGPWGAVTLSYDSVAGNDPQFLFFHVGSHGYLYWDADGTGVQDATLLAITMNGETVVASDLGFIQ